MRIAQVLDILAHSRTSVFTRTIHKADMIMVFHDGVSHTRLIALLGCRVGWCFNWWRTHVHGRHRRAKQGRVQICHRLVKEGQVEVKVRVGLTKWPRSRTLRIWNAA